MSNKKTLVVYYTRSGVTKKVADKITELLGAEEEELIDNVNRSGALGFIAAGKEATFKQEVPINPLQKKVEDYDLVIMGTPIWAGTISSAVRTFLKQNEGKIKQAAYFATSGSGDSGNAFKHIEEILKAEPVATISLTQKSVKTGTFTKDLESFLEKLK